MKQFINIKKKIKTIVIKSRFVMLLINLKICRIGERGKINEKIKSDIRENIVNFNYKVTSIHNINFKSEKIDKKINKKVNKETNI